MQGHPMLFADWLIRVNAASDLIIATTRQTAEDYKTAIIQRGEKAAPVSVVALAHEFIENPAQAQFTPLYEQISTPVLQAARLPYVLCVGTREIRKNNLGLARVWESLRQKHDLKLPRLIFAGRQGWMNEEFDRFLQRTGNANGSIVMVESPSDDEVAYLYKNCLFSVFPSFCEGWVFRSAKASGTGGRRSHPIAAPCRKWPANMPITPIPMISKRSRRPWSACSIPPIVRPASRRSPG